MPCERLDRCYAACLAYGPADGAQTFRVMVAGREAAGSANSGRLVAPAAPAALRARARRFVPAASPPALGTDTLHRVTAAALIAVYIVTRRRNSPCDVDRGSQCHASHRDAEQNYATPNQKCLHAVIYSRATCQATAAATECAIEIQPCSWSRRVGWTRLCECRRSRRHGRKNDRTFARSPRPWPWHQFAGRSCP